MSSAGRSCLVPVWWEEGSGSEGFAMGILPSPSFPGQIPSGWPLSRRSRSVLGMQPQHLAARRGEPGDKTG